MLQCACMRSHSITPRHGRGTTAQKHSRSQAPRRTPSPVGGNRLLIVEDEAMIALELALISKEPASKSWALPTQSTTRASFLPISMSTRLSSMSISQGSAPMISPPHKRTTRSPLLFLPATAARPYRLRSRARHSSRAVHGQARARHRKRAAR
jgi:hypothetical protein